MPQYTPEQRAQIDKERAENAAIERDDRRKRLKAEAQKEPMFQLSDEEKFGAVAELDAAWRNRLRCAKMIDVAHLASGWIVARCSDGDLIPAQVEKDGIITPLRSCFDAARFYGMDCDDAIWLLGLSENE